MLLTSNHRFIRIDKNRTKVILDTVEVKDKEMIFNCNIAFITQGFDKYNEGKLIQDAFPYLSPDEREFLMTGLTPQEWEDLFKDE